MIFYEFFIVVLYIYIYIYIYSKGEKRLENISRLMEFNYQSYIPVTNDAKNDNDNDNEGEEGKSNSVVDEYKMISDRIDKELEKIRNEVKNANQALSKSKFNPYVCYTFSVFIILKY